MNNIEYGQIIDYFTNNRIGLILVTALFLIALLFLISKTLRKSGLFLLIFTFLIDKLIRFIPIDVYSTFPNLSFVIMLMYILGLFIFFLKVFSKIFKKEKNSTLKEREKEKNSKIRKFLKFTGSLPLIVMILINIVNNYTNIFSERLVSNLTSLSFLFMAFITLVNTYRFVDKKDIGDDFDNLDFKEINKKLEKENLPQNRRNSNEGRKTLKTNKNIDKKINRKLNSKTSDRSDKVESHKAKEFSHKKNKEVDSNGIGDDLSNSDLVSLVSRGFDFPINKTILHIQNLVDGSTLSHTSQRCIARIIEDEEYKVDLEFKNYNEYDYGKFIDILMIYSKDKKSYKFKLELIPYENSGSKIVFYDPSDIFDSVKLFQGSFQGKNISMNFPKYKINFVTGN